MILEDQQIAFIGHYAVQINHLQSIVQCHYSISVAQATVGSSLGNILLMRLTSR